MQAIMLASNESYHVNGDIANCVKNWGGSLIIKAGSATSSAQGIDIAQVKGDSVCTI